MPAVLACLLALCPALHWPACLPARLHLLPLNASPATAAQVLSLQSSVLRGLFVEFLGTDNNRYGDSPVGGKRKIVGEVGHNRSIPRSMPAVPAVFVCIEPLKPSVTSACRHRTASQYDKLVLGDPFSGSSLFEAALFLRLCYRPRDVNPANLAAQRASLPALLALAHKLDAPRILTAVVAHMAGEWKPWLGRFTMLCRFRRPTMHWERGQALILPS